MRTNLSTRAKASFVAAAAVPLIAFGAFATAQAADNDPDKPAKQDERTSDVRDEGAVSGWVSVDEDGKVTSGEGEPPADFNLEDAESFTASAPIDESGKSGKHGEHSGWISVDENGKVTSGEGEPPADFHLEDAESFTASSQVD